MAVEVRGEGGVSKKRKKKQKKKCLKEVKQNIVF